MKTAICFCTAMCFYLSSISQLVDIIPEAYSPSHTYFQNIGQIIDENGIVRDEIQYYTENSSPRLFLSQNQISFVYYNLDSVHGNTSSRIDLSFPCTGFPEDEEECGNIVSSEQTDDHLNYYLPHCPQGKTNIKGFKRVEYQNVFPNIDIHFYSNQWGPKTYIVLNPGADPSDLILLFEGQDSVKTLITGEVEFYLGQDRLRFPQAIAYQINGNGQPISLGWLPTWNNLGSGYVSLSTQNYDPQLPLVIRIGGASSQGLLANENLDWSTYLGGDGNEKNYDIQVDNNEDIFTLTRITSLSFPSFLGEQAFSGGGVDVYLTKFDYGAERKWSTYFGGSENEIGQSLALSNNDLVYMCGTTYSTNLPLPVPNNGNFVKSVYGNGDGDAMLASFSKADGNRVWATYFGGNGDDWGYELSLNETLEKLFMVGTTTSASAVSNCSPGVSNAFPLCQGSGNRYFQSSVKGGRDAFIAEFDLNSQNIHSLTWSTYFGGENEEVAWAVASAAPPNGQNALFIGGYTNTTLIPSNTQAPLSPPINGAFPLSGLGSGEYLQNNNPNSTNPTGFVAKFDENYQLIWSTFLGGTGEDFVSDLAVKNNSQLFLIGSTSTPESASLSCTANQVGKFPICNSNGISEMQPTYGGGGSDLFIGEFSYTGTLLWSTYWGGGVKENGLGNGGADLAFDTDGNLYICGTTRIVNVTIPGSQTPTQDFAGLYYEEFNASSAEDAIASDAFILSFDSQNRILWGTHFGGEIGTGNNGDENAYGIAVYDNKRLYLSGSTLSLFTPYECPSPVTGPPFCDQILNGDEDGFISRFNLSQLTTSISEYEKYNPLKVYPIPFDKSISISLPIKKSQELEITLSTLTGQIVLSNKMVAPSGTFKQNISLQNLSKGMYIISVKGAEFNYVRSISK